MLLQTLKDKQLQTHSSVDDGTWVQLDPVASGHDMATEGTSTTSTHDSMVADPPRSLHRGGSGVRQAICQRQTNILCAHDDDNDRNPCDGADISMEVLRQCQRQVSGSVDDIVGLE